MLFRWRFIAFVLKPFHINPRGGNNEEGSNQKSWLHQAGNAEEEVPGRHFRFQQQRLQLWLLRCQNLRQHLLLLITE